MCVEEQNRLIIFIPWRVRIMTDTWLTGYETRTCEQSTQQWKIVHLNNTPHPLYRKNTETHLLNLLEQRSDAQLTPTQMSEIMHRSIKTVGSPQEALVLTRVVLTAEKVLRGSKAHIHPPTHTQSCRDKSILQSLLKGLHFILRVPVSGCSKSAEAPGPRVITTLNQSQFQD